MKKKILFAVVLTALVWTVPFSAYAGQWERDTQGWRWQEDDGSYAAEGWRWLDGNRDGISECYYFYEDGYMASEISVSDGSHINEDGAWMSGGEIQVVTEFQYHENPAWIQENLDKDIISGQVTEMINRERTLKGQKELRVNQELVANAEVRAKELIQKEGHIRPDGTRYFTVITVEHTIAGENYVISYMPCATTEGEASAYLVEGWLTSGIHHANLLNEKWQETGIGVYITGNQIYAVQLFI